MEIQIRSSPVVVSGNGHTESQSWPEIEICNYVGYWKLHGRIGYYSVERTKLDIAQHIGIIDCTGCPR